MSDLHIKNDVGRLILQDSEYPLSWSRPASTEPSMKNRSEMMTTEQFIQDRLSCRLLDKALWLHVLIRKGFLDPSSSSARPAPLSRTSSVKRNTVSHTIASVFGRKGSLPG